MVCFELCTPGTTSGQLSAGIHSIEFGFSLLAQLGHHSQKCHSQLMEHQRLSTFDSHGCEPDDYQAHWERHWIVGKMSLRNLCWKFKPKILSVSEFIKRRGIELLENAVVVRFNRRFRIKGQRTFAGDFSFWLSDMLFVEQKLPVQVAYIDGIQINLQWNLNQSNNHLVSHGETCACVRQNNSVTGLVLGRTLNAQINENLQFQSGENRT